MSDTVQFMVELKHSCQNYLLDANKEDELTQPIKQLLVAVKERLNRICNHEMQTDIIEVGENVKNVCYCIKCGSNSQAISSLG